MKALAKSIGIASATTTRQFVTFIKRTAQQRQISKNNIALVVQWHNTTRSLNGMTSPSKMEKQIAIGQMRATNDKQFNRDQVEKIVREAVAKNAEVCNRIS